METHCTYIPYKQTGYFSKLVIDYLDNQPQLQPFYNLYPDIKNIEKAISRRKNFEHRQVLVEQLQKQYAGLNISEKTAGNIKLLLSDNTFTVTTAHQPNIFTGPLYVIYKIFHVIKIAEELNAAIKENHFVPVYFMGSEDADLDELNNITINERKYVWQTKQSGAVGRMKVDKALLQLMNEMEGQLSVLPYGKDLIDIFRSAYTEKITIQQATLHVLNSLFGEYGLVIIIPDNPSFKKLFLPVLEKEIKEQFSYKAVTDTINKLEAHYKVQASGREINLFYLSDDKRERIEVESLPAGNAGLKFKVESLGLEWSLEEILKELNEHPERFSPNVILRGALQETILPNIIFVGGGGELAYWIELKAVFQQAGVSYPMLVLRNSFLLIDEKQEKQIKKLGLPTEDLFLPEHELMKKIVDINTNNSYSLNGKIESFEGLYNKLLQQANEIDASLNDHVLSLKTKALKKITELEKKMLRAEKRRFVEQQQHIKKLKASLFPGESLQERIENFSGFFATGNKDFMNEILQHSRAFNQQFGLLARSPKGKNTGN
ncbi:MAG TPA: bacillithiol biosynthesis cysteine-adding enzyme BshC [Parafilimonas sp.]|nr:bacillithiol biosynthesis cysteine-adding enzyme BshC [Parafilimonas sp.]